MQGVAISASGTVEGYEIFIKYLPHTATETGLQEYFAEAGPIVGDTLPHHGCHIVGCSDGAQRTALRFARQVRHDS